MRAGESGSGWLFFFHVIPAHRHHIAVRRIDDATRTIETDEHGGVLRSWHHTLHVEAVGDGRSRYSDVIDLDAGRLTGTVAHRSRGIYRYRQRRWRKLAHKHLHADLTPASR